MIDAQRPDLSQTEVAATFGLPILAAAQSHRISGGLIRYLLETDAIGTCAAAEVLLDDRDSKLGARPMRSMSLAIRTPRERPLGLHEVPPLHGA